MVLPVGDYTKRLISQAKMVTAKPAPGGSLSIKIPRKVGLGHGDLVSSWVLAIHKLAYSGVRPERVEYEPGTPEWNQEFQRRILASYDKQNDRALKAAERSVRSRMSGRRYREMFGRR